MTDLKRIPSHLREPLVSPVSSSSPKPSVLFTISGMNREGSEANLPNSGSINSSFNSIQNSSTDSITFSGSTQNFTDIEEVAEEKLPSYRCISPATRRRIKLIGGTMILGLKSLTTGVFLYNVLYENILKLGKSLEISANLSPLNKGLAAAMAAASGLQTLFLANPIDQQPHQPVDSKEEEQTWPQVSFLRFNQLMAGINFSLGSFAILSNFSDNWNPSLPGLAGFTMLNWLVDVSFYFMYMGPNIEKHAHSFYSFLIDIREGNFTRPELYQLPLIIDTLNKIGNISLFKFLTNALNANEIPTLINNIHQIEGDYQSDVTKCALAMASLGCYLMVFSKFLPIYSRNFNSEFDQISEEKLRKTKLPKLQFVGETALSSLQSAAMTGLIYQHSKGSELVRLVKALLPGAIIELSSIYTHYYVLLREQCLADKAKDAQQSPRNQNSVNPYASPFSGMSTTSAGDGKRGKGSMASIDLPPSPRQPKKSVILFLFDNIKEEQWSFINKLIGDIKKKIEDKVFLSDKIDSEVKASLKEKAPKAKHAIRCSTQPAENNEVEARSLEQRQLNCIQDLRDRRFRHKAIIVVNASKELHKEYRQRKDDRIFMLLPSENMETLQAEVKATLRYIEENQSPSALVEQVRGLLPRQPTEGFFNTVNFVAQAAKAFLLLRYGLEAIRLVLGKDTLPWQEQLALLALAIPMVEGERYVHGKRMLPIVKNHHLKWAVLAEQDEKSFLQKTYGFFQPIDSFRPSSLLRTKVRLQKASSSETEDHEEQERRSPVERSPV